MSESEAISHSTEPVTIDSLISRFRALGLVTGDVVIVHTSLSSLGWVCGGPSAVIASLLEVIGSVGTLVMPAYSSSLSEPSNWQNPPVPKSWCTAIRGSMPAFDKQRTPTRMMGTVAELFRTWPGAVRSEHPTSSMAAMGRHAEAIVANHPLSDPMGDGSPLARIYECNGKVLLLGVDHDKNTSLHLAERRAFGVAQAHAKTGAPLFVDGTRAWVEYEEPVAETDDFIELGRAFESAAQSVNCIGGCKIMSQRKVVDFGAVWLRDHRRYDGPLSSPDLSA